MAMTSISKISKKQALKIIKIKFNNKIFKTLNK